MTTTYEFSPKIYLLSNELTDDKANENIRFEVMKVNAKRDDNDSREYIYGMLPVELIPAAYIPFRYDDIGANFYRLSKNDKIKIQYYNDVFKDGVTEATLVETKKHLKDELKIFLKNKLNNKLSTFYTVEIEDFMLYGIFMFWIIILLIIMKVFYTYFSTMYSYILFMLFIIVLLFAIFWKMFYTLR
jgi:hypothetical protein